MARSSRSSILITLLIIFGLGAVLGMWLNKRPSSVPVSVPAVTHHYEALESGEAVVMRVYRELSPAVVNIVSKSLAYNFWMQAVPQTGQGTGFVIDDKGHVLTNSHVIGSGQNIEVTFMGDKKLQAVQVGQDPVSDLAVIKIQPFPGLAVAPLGNSENLTVGQRVIAIGDPFGFQHTVTSGFISALNRDLIIDNRTMFGMIQTDAAINPGNSGGPLINSRGEVIGVNTAIVSETRSFAGIGLALPINRAKKVAAQIIKMGRVMYPWSGIAAGTDLEPQLIRALGLPPLKGFLISVIAPGSPAYQSGLKAGSQYAGGYRGRPLLVGGDIILAVDETPISGFEDFQNIILQKNIGEQIKLKVWRAGQEFTVNLVLAEDPRMAKRPGV